MITFEKCTTSPFEVVERKGIGHPDSLADGISETISRDLCRFYLEEVGEILHHNVDKVLIIGGKTSPEFGGGRILDPPTVVVGGRATSPKGKPLDEIVRKAASSHLTKTVRYLQEYNIEPRTKEGSPELRSLIGKGANDTSIGVGYAPLSPTESLVLDLEKLVWKVKGAGEDTKIMAVRRGRDLQLVVAVAMVSRHIGSMEEYLEAKEKVKEAILAKVNAQVAVNAADQGDNIFFTVTGTSVEMGDDGATGRGNRGNGLITPMRPMTMEAIAGKNPVSHVGKIYNVLAKKAAQEIAELEGVKEAYVTLVSRIGSPIDCPMVKGAKVALDDAGFPKVSEGKINEILDYWVDQVEETAEEFVAGKVAVF